MNMVQYSLQQFFARDMVIKMQYTTCFEIVRVQKLTVQYTSKYLVDDMKQSVLPSVALQLITNQTPTLVRAKQSVASFKLKEKQVIGCMVTLQKQKCIIFYFNVFICIYLISNISNLFILVSINQMYILALINYYSFLLCKNMSIYLNLLTGVLYIFIQTPPRLLKQLFYVAF